MRLSYLECSIVSSALAYYGLDRYRPAWSEEDRAAFESAESKIKHARRSFYGLRRPATS